MPTDAAPSDLSDTNEPRYGVENDCLKRGKRYFQQGLLEKAMDAYSEALARNPASGTAHFNRGVVRAKLGGKAAAAVEDFKQAARLGHEKARELLLANEVAW